MVRISVPLLFLIETDTHEGRKTTREEKRISMMKAIIFDMDGVVVNSEPIHQRSEIEALAGFGLHLETKDLHPYAGTTRLAFQEGIEKQYHFFPDWKAVFQHKDQRFFELMEEVEAMPGVLDLIHAIKQEGLLLALATSGQKRSVDFVLQKFSLQTVFDTIVCAGDVTQSKPHPEVFLTAAQRLHTDPLTCVVFEDSINGIRAGKAANMYTIGLTSTFPSTAIHEADRIIDSFLEIQAHELKHLQKT